MIKLEQDVEVLIVVRCDQNPNDPPDPKLLQSVSNSVKELAGVKEVYLSNNNYDIAAHAMLEGSKIISLEAQLMEIDGVTKVTITILA